MNKTALLITGAMVVVMAAAGVASAHGKNFGDRGDRGARGPVMEEMFKQIDADGDGKITQAEIDAFKKARFDAVDADGDGKLTPEEMAAAHEARRAARFEAMVDRLDTDGDGLLSAEELAAGPSRRGPENMLDRLDKDGDGALTLEEIQEARMGRGGKGGKRHGHGHERGMPFFGRGMQDN